MSTPNPFESAARKLLASEKSGVIAWPFSVNDDGVFWRKQESDKPVELVKLAAPVVVVAKTRDATGENWGRQLQWRDCEGREHAWAMPMEMLASDAGAVRARLLSEGLSFIATNPKLREKFVEYLQTAVADKYVRCVARIGWHGDTYVLPDLAIGPECGEEMLYQTPQEAGHYWNVRGDIDEWREHVGRRCSGNSRLIIAVSAGFAGPLLLPAGAESGGLHIHGATSEGKTTAIETGGSVCGGGGKAGFVHTWRTTVNGLEVIAEAHNDGTLFLDELAQVDPREAAEGAYMLANGQGKGRMTRSIGGRRKPSWNILFVSSGEMTLAEHAASAGKRTKGGVEVRVLNINADAGQNMGLFENLHGAGSPDVFARELKEAARRYYGSPFRAFLNNLTRDRQKIERVVRAARQIFVSQLVPAGASGEVKRAAERFALIGAAGEIATGWGLTGWQANEAIGAAKRCFKEWVAARGTTGSSDVESALQQVRLYLEANGASRFQPLHSSSADPVADRTINRAGFRRVNADGETEYLIFPETFKKELCAGHNHRVILKELDKRGFLVRTKPAMTIKPLLPELGRPRVYCIRVAILEGDECGE